MPFDGGYYLIKEDLVRSSYNEHTAADPSAVSDEMLKAVNIIQATPWRINAWALDLMREVWLDGDKLGVLPEPFDHPLPPRLSDETWDRMSKEQRAEYKYELSKIHEYNASLQGKRESFLRKLNIAEALRDRPEIYFPHFLDFRGRIYPMPQDLNPQGDDIAKALLMFAEGKPLGKTGRFWLAVRLANTFGQDKLTFEERLAWVFENEEEIIRSAEDPMVNRFWTEADEPWSFLVTCREWKEAKAVGFETFPSHLPIPLDGTCNGLQHLSLMGRDPVGAKATNCSISDKRYDLYSEVAEVVKRLVTDDAVNGVEEAHAWIVKGIDRKTVKRAVMTTPYGVTDRGIRDQLISDGFTKDMENGSRAASYLKDKIVQALSETVTSSKEIMAYFQGVAYALAENNIPLRWRTPSGMEVIQAYHNLRGRRIDTLLGRALLWEEDKELSLAKRKQVLASAPNIIHSFDASMLVKTAIMCHDLYGIRSFAFIHDSYGVHAADAHDLSAVLRLVAAKMYETDWIAEFEDYVRSYAPGVELPKRPKLGDFDVSEVLQAPYFFA